MTSDNLPPESYRSQSSRAPSLNGSSSPLLYPSSPVGATPGAESVRSARTPRLPSSLRGM